MKRSQTPRKTPRLIKRTDGYGRLAPFFSNDYVFSNHFSAQFTIDGRTFNCSEQYYMYYKALVFGERKLAERVMGLTNPKEMKFLCTGRRNIKNFDSSTWRKVAPLVMAVACYHKFDQNPKLREFLIETQDAELVEAAPGDTFWGIGLSISHPKINEVKHWRGTNVLGKILTKLRGVLAEKYPEELKEPQNQANSARKRRQECVPFGESTNKTARIDDEFELLEIDNWCSDKEVHVNNDNQPKNFPIEIKSVNLKNWSLRTLCDHETCDGI